MVRRQPEIFARILTGRMSCSAVLLVNGTPKSTLKRKVVRAVRRHPVEQVDRDRSFAAEAAGRIGVGRPPLGNDRVVAGVQAGQHVRVEPVTAGVAGLVHRRVEPLQGGGELGRPGLAGAFPDAGQFPDQVGVAQRVADRIV